MTKNQKGLAIMAGVAGLVIVGYVIYRYIQAKHASNINSPTGTYGTNLNSIAPELIGGSSGPSVGPALSTPVTITLIESGMDQQAGPSDMDGIRQLTDRDDWRDLPWPNNQSKPPWHEPPQPWPPEPTMVGANNVTTSSLDMANPADNGIGVSDMDEQTEAINA